MSELSPPHNTFAIPIMVPGKLRRSGA